MELISKNIIRFIYQNDLNYNSIVNYYAGNGKLIIEFQDKYEDDSILLFNPLEKCNIEKNIFIFSTIKYNNKISLYRYIIDNILHNKIKDDSIINQNTFSFEKYIEKNCLNNSSLTHRKYLNQKENSESFKRDLLKIFIYIFFFEKSLLEIKIKEEIFEKNQNYYLIFIYPKFI